MQIEQNTIVTSVDELKAIMRHITANQLEGQINLTIIGNDIDVWQPSKQPNAESVHRIIERFPCNDVQDGIDEDSALEVI